MKSILNFKKLGFKPLVCIAILSFQFLSYSSFAQFSGGNGTENNPYIITTAAELAQLATYVNAGDTNYNDKHYKLANDIDLSAYGAGFNDGKGWIPIGKYYAITVEEYPFKGTFDGNNNKITGLYINDSTLSNTTISLGLFGCTHSASFQNLILENVNIMGCVYVGALTGDDWFSEFNNCSSSGTIRGGGYLGGLVGRIRNVMLQDKGETAVLTKCHSSCNVSGMNYIGGLAGQIGQCCNITACWTTGNVSGRDYVGGIASTCTRYIDLRFCYSTGNVTGNDYVGGIVGYLYSAKLYQGYSTGSITGNDYVGGIVGEVDRDCCYMAEIHDFVALNSSIKGNNHVGRIVGGVYALPPLDNAAYDSLLNNAGTVLWLNKGATQIDGEDISKETINADGSIGGRFKYWLTTQKGKLPGMFGTVDMPEHLRLGGSGSLSIVEQDNSDIRVYPNPTTGKLTIDNGQLTIENVKVYDISGKLVQSYRFNSSTKVNLDVSTLAKGAYSLSIYSEGQKTTKKFVKE